MGYPSFPQPGDVDTLEIQVWDQYWTDIERRIGPLFPRSEPRQRALAYLAGLLSSAERKNSWQLAEITGDSTPYAFQHLLGRADWNPDDLRDLLSSYVTDYLAEPDAIGVIDETGFLKKGIHSAGVQRQYSGTAGRIDNCQIGVFLTYATSRGHTLLDRDLYIPASWTDDPSRCERAGIPADRPFATKPALAVQMLDRARAAHVSFAWVTGDSVYGDDPEVRAWLEQYEHSYVLGVSATHHVWLDGRRWSLKMLLPTLPSTGWSRLSAGAGSKGPRWYDWMHFEVEAPAPDGWKHWVLVRRTRDQAAEMSAYTVCAPATTTLADHVRVAGMRWTVEESIQTAKGEVGLDQYEVRSWTGWYRHITLAMWASAFLSVIRAEHGAMEAPKKGRYSQGEASSLAVFKAHRNLRSD